MILEFFSPSSYKKFDWCPHSFFINYGLKFREPSNIKAELGNVVHDVLECVALYKKHEGEDSFTHKDLGTFSTKKLDIDDILSKAYVKYSQESEFDYEEEHFDFCKSSVDKVLDSPYDPRNLKIIEAEQYFEFLIMKPWAEYEYKGEHSYIGIKGFIDIVADHGDTIEIVDWKTGKRKNWIKNKVITREDLQTDVQLLMYFLAADYLYPDHKNIIVTIHFINHGGPFTFEFSKKDKLYIERLLKERFTLIKNTAIPKLLSYNRTHYRCKWCHFSKKNFAGSEKSICEFVRDKVKENGMDATIEKYRKKKDG